MGEMVDETTSFPDDAEESLSSVEPMDTETEDKYELLFEVESKFENIVTISSTARRRYDQYVVFFSQESPYHIVPYDDQQEFNMSLGFRHDSPVASPYGYTVKLAKRSRLTYSSLNIPLINGKTLGAAWFVSNCHTESGRENYVRELKKYYPVDVYGVCDGKLCPRDDPCEGMLNTDYHFYLSFENSICKDYITEKLWRHGYMHYVVPIVLKRSIVEPYVPPKSFIAADDFKSPKDLAKYLQYLMANKTAYLEYFIWRLDYHVVFLDGVRHTNLERPWGMCQKHYPVDVYGVCDGKLCPRDDPCEGMLNTDYHFYLSFENSICKDYITEKLWRQGYMHYVVPIVLKRSIVEPYVPPKSFIAADDFKSPKDLAKYLQYLMANKTAYLEYFMWRLDYHVVYLDGMRHTSLERPWGMCQLCRLLWEKPRRQYMIENCVRDFFLGVVEVFIDGEKNFRGKQA
ncbi:hypothetical protein GCK32_001696, partial [Trichostrongylus colubriformis]